MIKFIKLPTECELALSSLLWAWEIYLNFNETPELFGTIPPDGAILVSESDRFIGEELVKDSKSLNLIVIPQFSERQWMFGRNEIWIFSQ